MNWTLKYAKEVDEEAHVWLARYDEPEGLFVVGVSTEGKDRVIEVAKQNVLDKNYDATFNDELRQDHSNS